MDSPKASSISASKGRQIQDAETACFFLEIKLAAGDFFWNLKKRRHVLISIQSAGLFLRVVVCVTVFPLPQKGTATVSGSECLLILQGFRSRVFPCLLCKGTQTLALTLIPILDWLDHPISRAILGRLSDFPTEGPSDQEKVYFLLQQKTCSSRRICCGLS